jgi:beta-lactamase superfamily II metal-dependent hydrolase
VDSVTLRVWHPDSETIADGWDVNDNAVVLTVEYGAFRAVFGGDAGLPMEALRAGEIGSVTVLKVGHHGSPSASGPAWLAALRPAICVIEVGHNNYGHPDAGVVRRLGEAGCRVYRTDQDGDVDVVTDGRLVRVRAAGRDTSFIASKEPP